MQKKETNRPVQSKNADTKKTSAISLIIPVVLEQTDIAALTETIKQNAENHTNEIIICGAESLRSQIHIEAKNTSYFGMPENCNLTEMILSGVQSSSNDVVIISQNTKLQKSFSPAEIFTASRNLEHTKVLSIRFNDVAVDCHPNFITINKSLALWFLTKSIEEANDFRPSLLYILRKEDVDVHYINLAQRNPFQKEKIKKCVSIITRLKWNIIIPIKLLKEKTLIPLGVSSPIQRLFFWGLATLFLILLPLLSFDAGISGDEDKHVEQAVSVYNYFATQGADTSYMTSRYGPFQYYNISFDVLLHVINKAFHIDTIYEVRHALTAICGWLAILFAGLFARRLAGWRAGTFAMILLFITPVFLGHCYNNPKDIPFAMAYAMSLYYIIRMVAEYPAPRISTAILTAIGIGLSLNVRIGGLLQIAYLFFFIALKHLSATKVRELFAAESMKRIVHLLVMLSGISIIAYIIGIIFWPYAIESPIAHPIDALTNMTNFTTSLRQVFDGKYLWSDSVPWYYAIKYMSITIPLVVFIGWGLFIFIKKKNKRKDYNLFVFIALFATIFPVVYIIYKKSNVYGGWRHLLFVFIFLAVLAATGYEKLLVRFKKTLYIGIASILIAGCMFHPIRHIIRNHPNEYVYFNEFSGGVNKAVGKYELDYYYTSLRTGADWLLENRLKNATFDTTKPILIATNHGPITRYRLRQLENEKKIRIFYCQYYDRGNKDWDYGIFVNAYISPDQLKGKRWPPSNTIHIVTADKAPLCVVLERKTKNDFYGNQAYDRKDFLTAINYLEKAIVEEADNESALLNLSRVYYESGNYKRAIEVANQLIKHYPGYDQAMEILGLSQLQSGKAEEAIFTFRRITQNNVKYTSAYFYLGIIYLNTQRPYEAAQWLQKCIETNGNYKPAYQAMAQALQALGKNEEAQQYMNYANSI